MMAMISLQQNFGSFSRGCNTSNTTSTPTGQYTSFLVRLDTVELGKFLEKEGLGQHSQVFVTKKIDGTTFSQLDEQGLVASGVSDPIDKARLLGIMARYR